MTEAERLQEYLQALRQSLQIALIQQAAAGGVAYALPAVVGAVIECRRGIAQTKERLGELGFAVDHEQNDTASLASVDVTGTRAQVFRGMGRIVAAEDEAGNPREQFIVSETIEGTFLRYLTGKYPTISTSTSDLRDLLRRGLIDLVPRKDGRSNAELTPAGLDLYQSIKDTPDGVSPGDHPAG